MATLTPVKAIRAYCLEDCAGTVSSVRECARRTCRLYPYRLGKQPGRAGIGGKKRKPNSSSLLASETDSALPGRAPSRGE